MKYGQKVGTTGLQPDNRYVRLGGALDSAKGMSSCYLVEMSKVPKSLD